jgi:hypothetical protein
MRTLLEQDLAVLNKLTEETKTYRNYKIGIKDDVLATITFEKNAKVVAWGDEEVDFKDYLINTLKLNAEDDMIDLWYLPFGDDK